MIIDVIFNDNGEFIRPFVIDDMSSIIWSDRFNVVGDFELVLPVTETYNSIVKPGVYLEIEESEKTMYIENVKLESSADGNKLTAVGRSLESILDRRILQDKVVLDGNLQKAILKLLDDNFIAPTIPERKVSNMRYVESSDKRIIELSIEQLELMAGTTVLENIEALCKAANIGYKIIRDINDFVFYLYVGTDRSYEQDTNPYVVFSKEFDNLSDSHYIHSIENYKNAVFVYANINETTSYTENIGNTSGLDRREIYVDASSLEKEVDGVVVSEDVFRQNMINAGKQELEQFKIDEMFEGTADAHRPYVYGEDFFMGDIVQIADDFGNEGIVRVSELIISHNIEGSSMYPTFETLQKEEVI